jgi:hypothetical protein
VSPLRALIEKWRGENAVGAYGDGLGEAADELEALLNKGTPLQLMDDSGRTLDGWAVLSDGNPTRH